MANVIWLAQLELEPKPKMEFELERAKGVATVFSKLAS